MPNYELCIMNYALCIDSSNPRPRHIRRSIPPNSLQFHEHPLLMLVLHHHSFDPSKRPADDHHLISYQELRDKILIDNDILVPRFDNNLETLHLPVGYGEKIVFA